MMRRKRPATVRRPKVRTMSPDLAAALAALPAY